MDMIKEGQHIARQDGAHDATAAARAGEYLTFKLGGEEYGIDILRVQEIRSYEQPTRIANAPAFVTNFLCRARRNISGRKIAVARIFSLEIIIAIRFRDFARRLPGVFFAPWDPDTSIVAQRLGHERQLRLMFATDRDAGGMNLGEGGIGKERAPFVSAVGGGHIAAAGVGRKVKNVSISAGCEDHSIARVLVDLSRAQAAGDNSLGISIDDHQIEHLCLRKHLDIACGDLATKRLVTTEQKLLTGLSPRVKRS